MRVGITGARGFIGWHLRCFLKTLPEVTEVRLAGREEFSDPEKLSDFVDGLDVIFHLAGVNRASEHELREGNIAPARALVNTMEAQSATPCVVFASSTHAVSKTSVYGLAKAEASDCFSQWATRSSGRYITALIPHVFGEYGKPHYNSAVATFAHQIVRGENPNVNPEGQLELVHVQDLVERLFYLSTCTVNRDVRIEGQPMSVTDVVQRMTEFKEVYMGSGQLPDLRDPFDRALFNVFRGAIPHSERNCAPIKHSDDRGWLVETVRASSGGQCFVSTTRPRITRGNHFHRRKVERFFVLQGSACIRLRKLFSDEVVEYNLDGVEPSFVDIPTLYTHSITNIGDSELITLFWADEFFDPENPDTYYEEV